jgi:hypothetical protein
MRLFKPSVSCKLRLAEKNTNFETSYKANEIAGKSVLMYDISGFAGARKLTYYNYCHCNKTTTFACSTGDGV